MPRRCATAPCATTDGEPERRAGYIMTLPTMKTLVLLLAVLLGFCQARAADGLGHFDHPIVAKRAQAFGQTSRNGKREVSHPA